MHAYGKETVVVRIGNVELPSDLVRTEYIPYDRSFSSQLRNFIDSLSARADYYLTLANNLENNPLLAIDYLRRSYLLSGDASLKEQAKRIYNRSGLYPVQLPSGLGGEGAGVVEEVGPGVTDLKPGDRVVLELSRPERISAIVLAMGDGFFNYPRGLVVEISVNGRVWRSVWEGEAASQAVAASLKGQPTFSIAIPVGGAVGRVIRLTQTKRDPRPWSIAEVTVLGGAD